MENKNDRDLEAKEFNKKLIDLCLDHSLIGEYLMIITDKYFWLNQVEGLTGLLQIIFEEMITRLGKDDAEKILNIIVNRANKQVKNEKISQSKLKIAIEKEGETIA